MRKRQRKIIQVAIMILIIFSACSRENEIWNLVKMNNDISSFEFYKEKYLHGKYLDSAKIYIDNLSELHKSKPLIISQEITLPIASWDNKVCKEIGLQISFLFPQSREVEKEYRETGFKIIKEYFEQRGIKVVPLNDNCETKLLINLKMKTFLGWYPSIGHIYTGYNVESTYILMTDDKTPIRASIYKESPVAEWVTKQDNGYFSTYSSSNFTPAGPEPYSALPIMDSILLDLKFTSKLWNNSDSLSLNTRIPDYYTNYVYRLFCSPNPKDRHRAIEIMESHNFELKPEEIIPLFTYNLSNFCIENSNNDNLRDINKYNPNGDRICFFGFEVLRKMGVDAIDAAPILIEFMDFRNRKRWDNDYVEEILEVITRHKNRWLCDVSSWREWWFNYKCSEIGD